VDTNDPNFAIDAHHLFDWGSLINLDLVVHCAAVAPHRSAIDTAPALVGAENLALDANLFRWAAQTEPKRIIYLSSSAVYPIDLQNDSTVLHELFEQDQRVDRINIGKPDGAYGWTKLTGERLADWYRQQGGQITVVRPFSGYGEDQSTLFPFGAFIERALRREDPYLIWGDGLQVRDWVHRDDVVRGALAVAESEIRTPINLCTGIGTSMVELVDQICAQAGYAPLVVTDRTKPSGVAHRVGSIKQMSRIYEPRVTLEQGIARALQHRRR
jgi:nucleoside-diphosphate-sugar epimerase